MVGSAELPREEDMEEDMDMFMGMPVPPKEDPVLPKAPGASVAGPKDPVLPNVLDMPGIPPGEGMTAPV